MVAGWGGVGQVVLWTLAGQGEGRRRTRAVATGIAADACSQVLKYLQH